MYFVAGGNTSEKFVDGLADRAPSWNIVEYFHRKNPGELKVGVPICSLRLVRLLELLPFTSNWFQ